MVTALLLFLLYLRRQEKSRFICQPRSSDTVPAHLTDLTKIWGRPVNPVGCSPGSSVELVVSRPVAGADALTKQELVEECIKCGRKAGWPSAVRMAADLLEADVVGSTESLVDGPSGVLATVTRQGTEPDIIGVLVRDHSARSDQSEEQVVVVRQLVQVVDVVLEVGAEPDVLADDFGGGLDRAALSFFVLADTPACVTSGARFLRDGEGNTGLEGAGHEGTLAVTRAAGNGELGSVDLSGGSGLEDVDDTGNTPDPCGHGGGAVAGAVNVVEETLAAAAAVGLLGNGRAWVVESCNLIAKNGGFISQSMLGNGQRNG